MSATEISNGLVLPYAAITIAGKGGAAAVLLITFVSDPPPNYLMLLELRPWKRWQSLPRCLRKS